MPVAGWSAVASTSVNSVKSGETSPLRHCATSCVGELGEGAVERANDAGVAHDGVDAWLARRGAHDEVAAVGDAEQRDPRAGQLRARARGVEDGPDHRGPAVDRAETVVARARALARAVDAIAYQPRSTASSTPVISESERGDPSPPWTTSRRGASVHGASRGGGEQPRLEMRVPHGTASRSAGVGQRSSAASRQARCARHAAAQSSACSVSSTYQKPAYR